MIDDEQRNKIKQLYYAEHFKIYAICKALRVHHTTVKKIINPNFDNIKRRPLHVSSLDDYQAIIAEKLDLYPKIRATRLIQILADRGYKGSISSLRTYLRRERPKHDKVYMRMVVHPGEQGQVDWAHCGSLKVGSATRKLYAFVMVLSYSRAVYAEFCLNMKTATFLRCHERAFRYFNGIPRIILYDNLKSAVIARRDRLVRFNKELLDFSGFYAYEPRPCNPFRGNEKGRVERTIRYIRDNYLAARELTDLKTANESLKYWCDNIANKRCWPEDRQYLVKSMWAKERAHLLKLTDRWMHPQEQVISKSRKTPWLIFDLNSYSISPEYVNKLIMITADDDLVTFSFENKIIAKHLRSYDRNKFFEQKEHRQNLLIHSNFGRSNLFRENIVKDFPVIDKILKSHFEVGHDIPSIVRQLYRIRYACGDKVFKEAVDKTLNSKQFSIESIRYFATSIEKSSSAKLPISVTLPKNLKVRSLEIKEKPLSIYDEL